MDKALNGRVGGVIERSDVAGSSRASVSGVAEAIRIK